MNLFKLMVDWILTLGIFFRNLFKEKEQLQFSEGNMITVEAEIHHERIKIDILRKRSEAEAENEDEVQNHNNIELLNIDAIEKA